MCNKNISLATNFDQYSIIVQVLVDFTKPNINLLANILQTFEKFSFSVNLKKYFYVPTACPL